jgi:cytoskeletal protein CcmA (bactofilin family)
MTAASAPAPAPPTEPSGVLDDRGTTRRDTVRATRWSVSGTAKVAGDVRVGDATSRGTLSVGGTLSAGSFRARGTLDVEGPMDVRGPCTVRGSLRAGATVHAVDLDLEGVARCGGAVTVDRVASVEGTLEAPQVNAGALRLKGSARIPGAVHATEVTAELKETSVVGPITARVVRLHAKLPNLVDKALFHERVVSVDRIEAETVELEGVKAAFVRSPHILLGRGCHVTEVEGTIVRQHPSSHVGPESRSPRPYGLRR